MTTRRSGRRSSSSRRPARRAWRASRRSGLAGILLVITTPGLPAGHLALSRPRPEATPPPQAAPGASDDLRRKYAERLQKKFLLERERDLKRLQLALAEDDDPYLLIDLADHEIDIVVRTTTVNTVPLLGAEIEGERHLFSAVEPPPDWANRTYNLVGKSGPPPETEKIVPGAASPAGSEVNPRAVTPQMLGLDEHDDFPARYTLLFADGVAVSIDGIAGGDGDRSWLERGLDALGDALSAPDLPDVEGVGLVRVWIHLGLEASEAKALYPSLYTGMRAMFRMPGDPRL